MAVGRPAHSVPRAVRHPSSPPPRRSAPIRALLRGAQALLTDPASLSHFVVRAVLVCGGHVGGIGAWYVGFEPGGSPCASPQLVRWVWRCQ